MDALIHPDDENFKESQLHFKYSCFFFIGYSGDTCSEDKNGCAEIECFGEVECLDIPAPGTGAVCGSCPNGFTGDGVKCSGNEIPDITLIFCFIISKLSSRF